jgi:hypothetical protein
MDSTTGCLFRGEMAIREEDTPKIEKLNVEMRISYIEIETIYVYTSICDIVY